MTCSDCKWDGRELPLRKLVELCPKHASVDAMIAALALCAIPYEALLMDAESRRWIAPVVWIEIEKAVIAARPALVGDSK